MLQAFVDESYDKATFVIAGYVATVENWMKLSDEWAQLLAMRSPHFPAISEFHMTEMRSTPERMEMAGWFYRIIEKHVMCAITCVIDLDGLNRAASRFNWPQWTEPMRDVVNPYLAAFTLLNIGMAAQARKDGISGGVDFVFDENTNMSSCMRGWELYRKMANPMWLRGYGAIPIFRNSATTLPLQAADLFAYWVRLWATERKRDPGAKVSLPWKGTRAIPLLPFHFGEEDFLAMWKANLLAEVLRRAGVPNPEAAMGVLTKNLRWYVPRRGVRVSFNGREFL